MDNHGRRSIPSPEIGEIWGHCRDNLKGTTPLAQYQIECLQRDYLPPDKAHIKRLKKCRPLVLIARPKPAPTHDIGDINHARRLGLKIQRMNKRIEYGTHDPMHLRAPAKPTPTTAFDYTRNATVPPDRDNWSHEHWVAESERLSREMEQARNA